MKYVIEGEGRIARTVSVDDFEAGLASRGSGSRLLGATRDPSNDDVTVALHFNELEVDPGQIERETFRQLMRVVPEFRRDLTVAMGTFFTHSGPPKPLDIAAAHLAGEPKVWSTHSIEGLGTLLADVEVAFALVRGLRRDQLDVLHQALLAESESYLGAVEVNLRRPTHQHFYEVSPRFRLVEADLRLLYSAREYYGELGDWDHRPHELFDVWESEGIFKSVCWEEDKQQSAADERQAEEEISEWMAMIDPGEPAAD